MIKIGNQKYIGRNVLNKKYNIVLFLLFIVYLFGYFSISKTLIPIMCLFQVFLIEHIFRVRNRIMQIGEMIIIVASIILFIDSILSLWQKAFLYNQDFHISAEANLYPHLSSSLNLTGTYCWYSLSSYNLTVNLRLVCYLIFVDKKKCSSVLGRAFFIVILIRFLPTLGGVLGNLVPWKGQYWFCLAVC